jgi:hypothetical protein
MLKTEQNTPIIEKKVLTSARKHFKQRKNISAVFEHGQWWIKRVNPYNYRDEVYNVVDAEGVGTVNDFDFELVY